MGQVLSVLFFSIGIVEGAAFIIRVRRAYLPIWHKERKHAKCPFSGSSEPIPVPSRNRRSLVGELVRGVADRVWSKKSSEKGKTATSTSGCPFAARNVTPAGDKARGEDAKVQDKGRKVSSDPVFPTLKEREEVEESRHETVERGPSPTLPMVKSPVPRMPPLGPEFVRVTKPVLDGCVDPGLTPPPPSPPPPSAPELPPDLVCPSEPGVSESQDRDSGSKVAGAVIEDGRSSVFEGSISSDVEQSSDFVPRVLSGSQGQQTGLAEAGAFIENSRSSIVEESGGELPEGGQTAEVVPRVVKSPLTRIPPITPETLIARQSSFESQTSSKAGEVEVARDELSDMKPVASDTMDGGRNVQDNRIANVKAGEDAEQHQPSEMGLGKHGDISAGVEMGETPVDGAVHLGEIKSDLAPIHHVAKREQESVNPQECEISRLDGGKILVDAEVDEQFVRDMEDIAKGLGSQGPERERRQGPGLSESNASVSTENAGDTFFEDRVSERLNHETNSLSKVHDDQRPDNAQLEPSGLSDKESSTSGGPLSDARDNESFIHEKDDLVKAQDNQVPMRAQREDSRFSDTDTSGVNVEERGTDVGFSGEVDSLTKSQSSGIAERARREGSGVDGNDSSTSGVESGARAKKSKGGKSSKEVSWADDVIDVERESRKSDVVLPGKGGKRSGGGARGEGLGAKSVDGSGEKEDDEDAAGDGEGARKIVVRVAGDGVVEIPPPPPFQPPPLPPGKEDPGEVRLRFERPRASRSPSNPREEAGELPPLVASGSGRHASLEAGETPSTSGKEAFWLIFSGEYTKAMSKEWHSGHFCCWQCDESLTGQRYVLRDDHPYCVRCYESVFANLCEQCNKTIGIDSKDLSYKDKHWHEACFLCTKCRVSLVDKQFGSKADKIYCGNCYDAQFASRCDGCGEIFRAGTKKMEYKTRQWHEKCFCCCVCKTAIGTKSFIPREQEIYCATCYEEKFATRCVKCNKIITTGGVTYKNEPWHRECFTCTHCNTSLAGQRFTSRDEKPYCAECFGELFAKRCVACSRPITGIGGTRFISFEDRHWHNDCFICASCKSSLVGRGFITDGEDIICPECAKQKLM